jgi:hypothetical protein
MKTRFYKYVLHHLVTAYEDLGWLAVADLGPIHGEWSILMEWRCSCKMVMPV